MEFILVPLALLVGVFIGFVVRRYLAESKMASAEAGAAKILKEAREQASRDSKETLQEAKDQIRALRTQFDSDMRERRKEYERTEKRLTQREQSIEDKIKNVERQERAITEEREMIATMQVELKQTIDQEKKELEKIAGMTTEQAKQAQLKLIEEEVSLQSAVLIREIEANAREEGEKRARNIISLAIQRCASDHTAETTVSVVPLPGDEMKGRIIGREGRNIRAIENLTGINLIIDDTPEAITLSGFDPVRREIAKICLEKLIADGRIHPTSIEDTFKKAKAEVDVKIKEAGIEATIDADIHGLHQELVRVLGRLMYRTSYGQNVLKHSLEVAHIAGIMAAELGADIKLAKRAGLLHDIGKAVDHEIEGTHPTIGADLARRLGESPAIYHAIEAHHGQIEPQTVEAVIVQAADAVSASRPGARREVFETYIKRLEKLETIADSYEGVEKVYAMQAGREIRVMVKPDAINDDKANMLANAIARQIEDEMEYPGQIKVTVIRENRAIDYAK